MKPSVFPALRLLTLCKATQAKLFPPPEQTLLKLDLKKRPDCELSLGDLREPFLGWGRGGTTTGQAALQLHILFLACA